MIRTVRFFNTAMPLMLGAAVFHAQGSIPATQPTASSPAGLAASPARSFSTSQPTQIQWNGSKLEILASGDELNQLLHAIGSRTGVRITGAAPAERIFGHYGPGTVDQVITQLLDGVAVNMVMLDHPGAPELSLTARTATTTTSVRPQVVNMTRPEQQQPVQQPDSAFGRPRRHGMPDASMMRGQGAQGGGLPPNPQRPGSDSYAGAQQDNPEAIDQSSAAPDMPVADTPDANNVGAGSEPGTANGDPNASPNGVRTPQEIFEQLQKLRNQQQQSPDQ